MDTGIKVGEDIHVMYIPALDLTLEQHGDDVSGHLSYVSPIVDIWREPAHIFATYHRSGRVMSIIPANIKRRIIHLPLPDGTFLWTDETLYDLWRECVRNDAPPWFDVSPVMDEDDGDDSVDEDFDGDEYVPFPGGRLNQPHIVTYQTPHGVFVETSYETQAARILGESNQEQDFSRNNFAWFVKNTLRILLTFQPGFRAECIVDNADMYLYGHHNGQGWFPSWVNRLTYRICDRFISYGEDES